MALVFNSTRTETNTKECGVPITDMDRVLTGVMRMENSDVNIQVIGSRIKSMVEVPSSIRMEIDMMVTGLMVTHKVRVE